MTPAAVADLPLVHEAERKINGGNAHSGRVLIAAYRHAVEFAADPRCKSHAEAIAHLDRCQRALRDFVARS